MLKLKQYIGSILLDCALMIAEILEHEKPLNSRKLSRLRIYHNKASAASKNRRSSKVINTAPEAKKIEMKVSKYIGVYTRSLKAANITNQQLGVILGDF